MALFRNFPEKKENHLKKPVKIAAILADLNKVPSR
jgi:hypothetical protein